MYLIILLIHFSIVFISIFLQMLFFKFFFFLHSAFRTPHFWNSCWCGVFKIRLMWHLKWHTCIAHNKIISQKWNKNETDNKAFLCSTVWQHNKITCFVFRHKFPVKTFFVKQKCPVRLFDQTKLLPVKTSNLLDNCPMTDCYLQACPCFYNSIATWNFFFI